MRCSGFQYFFFLVQLTRRVILELLRQFKLNQIRFSEKYLEMAEGTESTQKLTDNHIFHDIDLCQEICLMMRVTQNNGKALPIFSFMERQIMKK